MKSVIVIACTIGVSCATGADAQSLRCNGDLAGVGDTKASLMHKCGKPALTDYYCKPVPQIWQQPGTAGGVPIVAGAPCERMDEWTYYPGSGQFVTTFRLESGVVREIKYGDRIN